MGPVGDAVVDGAAKDEVEVALVEDEQAIGVLMTLGS